MTIFHTIKYPLSDPPTQEELQSLPYELYRQISNRISNTSIELLLPVRGGNARHLSNMKNYVNSDYKFYMKEINRIIFEYEGSDDNLPHD